jgi:hypothetical protein
MRGKRRSPLRAAFTVRFVFHFVVVFFRVAFFHETSIPTAHRNNLVADLISLVHPIQELEPKVT